MRMVLIIPLDRIDDGFCDSNYDHTGMMVLVMPRATTVISNVTAC